MGTGRGTATPHRGGYRKKNPGTGRDQEHTYTQTQEKAKVSKQVYNKPYQEGNQRHRQGRSNQENPQATHRQPRWQEATSGQVDQLEEEMKEDAHVPWNQTRLEGANVPAFLYAAGTNNSLRTH